MRFSNFLVSLTFLATASVFAPATQAQTLIGASKTTPTFPITISQPGSYRLAANLVVPTNNVRAIVVTAPNVTLDLGGFSITGPNTCDMYSKTCTQPYTEQSIGIYSTGAGTMVMNGTVAGFSSFGINFGAANGVVRNVSVAHNILGGVALQDGRIEAVSAQWNGTGIMLIGGLLVNSVAANNLYNGVQIGGGMMIGSSSTSNGAAGVQGVNASGAVRESYFAYNKGSALNSVTSMGNNLCNNVAC